MTPFEQLKLLYTQLFNIRDEILKYFEKEWYNDAVLKSSRFDAVCQEIKFAKKTLQLSEAEKTELEKLDEKAKEIIAEVTQKAAELRAKVKVELNKTKINIKVNDAYSQALPVKGQILDEED